MEKYQKEQLMGLYGNKFPVTNFSEVNDKFDNLDYSFGMGYGLSDQSNLNITATMRQEFDNSSEIRLNYSKKF